MAASARFQVVPVNKVVPSRSQVHKDFRIARCARDPSPVYCYWP